jgi:hypothetical protein
MQHLTQHSGTHHGLYGAIWHLAGTSHDKSLPSKHRPDIPTTFVNSSPLLGTAGRGWAAQLARADINLATPILFCAHCSSRISKRSRPV